MRLKMKSLGISQEELGRRIGTSGETINHVYNQTYDTSEWVMKIAAELSIPLPVIEATPEIQEIVTLLRRIQDKSPELVGDFRRSLARAVEAEEGKH